MNIFKKNGPIIRNKIEIQFILLNFNLLQEALLLRFQLQNGLKPCKVSHPKTANIIQDCIASKKYRNKQH